MISLKVIYLILSHDYTKVPSKDNIIRLLEAKSLHHLPEYREKPERVAPKSASLAY